MEETGFPVEDTGLSVEELSSPVEETGFAVENLSFPVEEAGLSVEDLSLDSQETQSRLLRPCLFSQCSLEKKSEIFDGKRDRKMKNRSEKVRGLQSNERDESERKSRKESLGEKLGFLWIWFRF